MPSFFKKKLLHPVDTAPSIEPVQNYILEEKAILIKDLEKIKLKLHNLTVEMVNNESEGKSEKKIESLNNSGNQYNQQFNEVLELIREFSVTLKSFDQVVAEKVKNIREALPNKMLYLRDHHSIDALRTTFDFFVDAQMHINNAARLLLTENATLKFNQQIALHTVSVPSCNIL